MRLGLSRMGSRHSSLLRFIVCAAFFAAAFCFMVYKLQPAFIEYSKTYANNVANEVVNEAVNEVFSKEGYKGLSNIIEKSDRSIQAVETDTVKANRLKADINQTIQNNIEKRQSDTVYVPLGSATNFYFLAGLGPKIPVKIYPVSIVSTDFSDKFESVGINQVKHMLYLDVSIQMSLAGFGFAQTQTVSTSTLLVETIIVGDTPQYYGNGTMTAAVE